MRSILKRWFNLDFYVSSLDRFLEAYRQKHPRMSASQRAEIEKYAALNKQRDDVNAPTTKTTFWKNF